MGIQSLKMDFVGQANDGSIPRMGRLKSTDALETISAAGYLDSYVQSQGIVIYPSDFVFAKGSDGSQVYKPVISVGGSIQLELLP